MNAETDVSTQRHGGGVWRVLRWPLSVFVVWVLLVFAAGEAVDKDVPVVLPMRVVMTDGWDNGFAHAEGTWEIENSKSATPFQTSTLTCYRDGAVCREARAMIVNRNYLAVALDEYDVEKWDAHTIIYSTDSPTCVHYIYTIDRASEAVSGVRVVKAPDDPRCVDLERRLVLRLVDGLGVHMKAREEALPWWGQIVVAPFKLLW